MKIKVIILLAVVALSSSCKKDKSTAPESTGTPTGTFMLHLHNNIDDTEVEDYDSVYAAADGRNVSLTMAQLYISEIQLVKADGSVYDVSGVKILKVQETETYMVGNVPVGNYKTLKFKVGLDPATNQLNPLTPSDSALLNKPAMWFSNPVQPDGYVFLNLQGNIDTTAAMTGALVPFSYKIGTNANYKQVTMPDKNMTILDGQVEYGHININFYNLFNGIQLNQNTNLFVNTTADNTSTTANTIVNNIPSLFVYE
jgi:hypothetical protein